MTASFTAVISVRIMPLMSPSSNICESINGISKNKFHLFLKECEFRFNYGPPKKRLTTLKSGLKQRENYFLF
jgi:hypothetical protein